MSENVEVEFGDKPGDTATLLLAAAEELGLEAGVVQTRGRSFVVPEKVRDKAFKSESKKAPAKKAPAKKSEK
jgi:hypothetical protein